MGLAWALGARRTHSSCTNPLYIELPERLVELCVLIKLCNKKKTHDSRVDSFSGPALEDMEGERKEAHMRSQVTFMTHFFGNWIGWTIPANTTP